MLFSIIWYFIFLKKTFRDGICSFSSFAYIISIPFVMIPGYFISNHSFTYFNTVIDFNSIITNDVDYTIYCLYIFFMLISSMGLTLGHSLGRRFAFKLELRDNYIIRIKIVMCFIILYIICYHYWLPQIPLFQLFTSDYISAVTSRLSITHGLASLDPPLLFRYWRIVLQLFSLSLILYYLNTRTNLFIKILLFVLQSWCMVFTLEKTGLMYFLLALIGISLYTGAPRYRKVKLFIIMLFTLCGIVLMYVVFSRQTSPINSILVRIYQQTAVLPFEIEYIRQHGFLGIRNIPLHLFDDLLGIKLVDVSKMAIIELYPQYNTADLSGAAGGLSLANLYMSFGWFSLLFFFIYVSIVGFVDRIIFSSIKLKKIKEQKFLISLYYAFAMTNLFSLISSVFTLFSLTLVFNPKVWLFLCFVSLFVKYRFKIYRKTYISLRT